MPRQMRQSRQVANHKATKSASPASVQPRPTKSLSPQQKTLLPSPAPSTEHLNSLPQINLIPHPRLYHAMVDVELTAEPILQIVSKMAADAITDIESKAVASGTTNIRGFDWTNLAKQSITKAEADARNTVMNLIAPMAEDAFAKVKAANEAEVGTEVMIAEDDQHLLRAESAVPVNGVEQSVLDTVPEETEGEDRDAEMIDADVVANHEDPPASVTTSTDQFNNATATQDNATPADDEDAWTGTCFCGYGDVFGDEMVHCEGAGGKTCRHEWYHADCLKVAVYKHDLPQPEEDWICPYCCNGKVKAKMVPATMMKKSEHKHKIELSGQPMLPGF